GPLECVTMGRCAHIEQAQARQRADPVKRIDDRMVVAADRIQHLAVALRSVVFVDAPTVVRELPGPVRLTSPDQFRDSFTQRCKHLIVLPGFSSRSISNPASATAQKSLETGPGTSVVRDQ